MSRGPVRPPGGIRAGAALTLAVVILVLTAATALASNDPFFGQQWGLTGATSSINAPQAWCASTGGVMVADIDTGADFGHQDLAGRLVAGARFTSGTASPTDPNPTPDATGQAAVQDDNGHGTMTTGLMVANKDNGVGIAGIAPASHALIVKVLNSQGGGNLSDVAAGIHWAASHGARVINLSLGTSVQGVSLVPDSNTIKAIQDVSAEGVAVAVAAGNNQVGLPVSQYAQITPYALVAGAVGPQGEIAWYSSYGQGVNIYAPGGDDPAGSGNSTVNVVSTYFGNRYAAGQGTSFAAPHVAGALALLMSRGMTSQAARQQILNTAVVRNGQNGFAAPELDAAAALGTSGGCASPPPAANDGGHPPATAPRSTAGHSGGAPSAPAAPAAAAASSPSPSASASASASPSDAAGGSSSPRALAHDPPSKKGGSLPVPAIAAVTVLGAGGAFAGFRFYLSLR